jgi:hypothetical protein
MLRTRNNALLFKYFGQKMASSTKNTKTITLLSKKIVNIFAKSANDPKLMTLTPHAKSQQY